MFDKIRSTLARMIGPKKSMSQLAMSYRDSRSANAHVDRSARAALEANAKANVLHSVILKIAENVAATDWTLSKVQGASKRSRTLALKRVKTLDARQKLASTTELENIEQHEILDLLARGNSVLNGFDTILLFQTFLDLTGEAFLVKDREDNTRVTSLWAIPPTWVTSTPDANEPTFVIQINGFRRTYLVDDVVWCKIPDPRNPYKRGYGPTMALANEIVTDEYAAEFVQAFFYNGAMPDAIIGFDKAKPEEIDAVQERWDQGHRGQKKSHRIRFVSHKPEVIKLEPQFKDRDVVALRRYLRDEVLQQFGMPPEIMGILNDSNKATITQAENIFTRWLLLPRLWRIVRCLQEQLIDPIDDSLILGFLSPVPEDEDQQLRVMTAQPSAFTRGDWRRAARVPTTDADDVYVIKPPVVIVPASDEVTGPVVVPDRGTEPTKMLWQLYSKAARTDVEAVISAVEASLLSDGVEDIWAPEMRTLYGETYGKLGLDTATVMSREKVAADIARLKDTQLGFVDETTRASLHDTLTTGVANGEGALELTERVNEVFDFADTVRAERIARTEVASSSNFTTFTAHQDSGLVAIREWIAVGPPRTRISHRAPTDGQRRALNELFDVGTSQGPYPGAIDDASENFRCRCTTVPVFELEAEALVVAKGQKLTDDHFLQAAKNLAEEFDARNMPWINAAETHFRSGFDQQQADAVAAVKRIFPV